MILIPFLFLPTLLGGDNNTNRVLKKSFCEAFGV